jgi:sec-independent protein translocase protein TatC
VARLKSASFDDRMTLVEHLDELRTRIIFSGIVLVLAIALCFWQNGLLLDIAREPLPSDQELTTLSPTEPFFITIRLSIYAGLLLSLPVLLYQVYAFVLPAFSPSEKRVVLPLLLSVPFLFIAGVVFAYYVVMPAALDFLLGFNSDDFDTQLRAGEYIGFFALTEIAVGLLFQIPVGVIAVTRLGIVTPQQLAHNRRYALLIIAVLAMLLPGTDPVTMLISMLPLYVLFEFSLLLARWFGTPADGFEDETEVDEGPHAPATG